MKVLVIGRSGQLAKSLAEVITPSIDFVCLGRPDLDLASPTTLRSALNEQCPALVINTAAYTAVDKAEHEPELARNLNKIGAATLAELTAERGVPIIHLSTDYVYDGAQSSFIGENSPVNPLNTYGRTKAEGEDAVRQANARHIILRTSWIYSGFGSNFVKTMLNLAGDRDEVSVVADQIGHPTYGPDLAAGIVTVARLIVNQNNGVRFGTYHIAGRTTTSWAGLAKYVFQSSKRLGGPSARVIPIASKDYPTPATRPEKNLLDLSAAKTAFGIELPGFEQSVPACVRNILQQRGSW